MNQELNAHEAGAALRQALSGAGMTFVSKGAKAGELSSFNTGSLDATTKYDV